MELESCTRRTDESTRGEKKLKRLLEKIFASRAQTRVVQHFLDRPKEFFNLSRLAKETGLAHSTIHRVMQPLVDMGLVKEIKAGQQIRLFILETEDDRSKIISDFYDKIKPHLETS
ncbi:MAG: helix-turn-helix domain-containing protein [Candidatus Thorarchaeota archaeon]